MDDYSPAEALPERYLAVLRTVARLERAGERAYAYDLRRKATRTYSTRWDERGLRRLERLERDGQARLDATGRSHAAPASVTATSES